MEWSALWNSSEQHLLASEASHTPDGAGCDSGKVRGCHRELHRNRPAQARCDRRSLSCQVRSARPRTAPTPSEPSPPHPSGHPIEPGIADPNPHTFRPSLRPSLICMFWRQAAHLTSAHLVVAATDPSPDRSPSTGDGDGATSSWHTIWRMSRWLAGQAAAPLEGVAIGRGSGVCTSGWWCAGGCASRSTSGGMAIGRHASHSPS